MSSSFHASGRLCFPIVAFAVVVVVFVVVFFFCVCVFFLFIYMFTHCRNKAMKHE